MVLFTSITDESLFDESLIFLIFVKSPFEKSNFNVFEPLSSKTAPTSAHSRTSAVAVFESTVCVI